MKRLVIFAVPMVLGCTEPAPPEVPDRVAEPKTAPPQRAAPEPAPVDPEARAETFATDTLVMDGHIDLPHRMREDFVEDRGVAEVGTGLDEGDFDWVRAEKGGLDAPFMSIYVPASLQPEGGAKNRADQLIDFVEAVVDRHPDKFALADSPASIEDNFARGLVSLPLGSSR